MVQDISVKILVRKSVIYSELSAIMIDRLLGDSLLGGNSHLDFSPTILQSFFIYK